jgi:hypothetical protein
MFAGGFMMKAAFVTGGAIGTHVVGNMIANGIAQMAPAMAGQAWVKPVAKLTAAWGVSWACGSFKICSKPNAQLLFLGGVASVLLDIYNENIRPMMPGLMQGYGDYVQMPYSGYGTPAQVAAGEFGDYVQMPYSGYGTPAQVAAGDFGGFGGSGEMATFGPTF